MGRWRARGPPKGRCSGRLEALSPKPWALSCLRCRAFHGCRPPTGLRAPTTLARSGLAPCAARLVPVRLS